MASTITPICGHRLQITNRKRQFQLGIRVTTPNPHSHQFWYLYFWQHLSTPEVGMRTENKNNSNYEICSLEQQLALQCEEQYIMDGDSRHSDQSLSSSNIFHLIHYTQSGPQEPQKQQLFLTHTQIENRNQNKHEYQISTSGADCHFCSRESSLYFTTSGARYQPSILGLC